MTTIVGPSDAGKSAVIRSLRWLCQNSPSGIEFLKNGTTIASVELSVDGKKVERSKSATNNTYSIDGTELRAFGQGVPDAVADVLNVADINFQAQLDPPYWLTLTPGEVSRQLNALIDLSIIDETMRNINRTLSRAKVELELADEKVKKKTAQLEDMQWVNECQMDATVLKASDKLLAEKREDLGDLVRLDLEILSLTIVASKARNKLSAVAEVGKQAAYARNQRQVLDGVAGVLSTVKSLQGKLQFRTISTEAVDSAKVAADKEIASLRGLMLIRNEYQGIAPLVKNKEVAASVFEVDVARGVLMQSRGDYSALKKTIDTARAFHQIARNKKVLVDFTIVDAAKEEYTICKGQLDGIKKLVSDIQIKDLEKVGLQLRLADEQKTIEEKTKGQICPVCGKFGL